MAAESAMLDPAGAEENIFLAATMPLVAGGSALAAVSGADGGAGGGDAGALTCSWLSRCLLTGG